MKTSTAIALGILIAALVTQAALCVVALLQGSDFHLPGAYLAFIGFLFLATGSQIRNLIR